MLDSTTPESGAVASVGPGIRFAFSMNRTAMCRPSGDHCGSLSAPLIAVIFFGFPEPGVAATYNCTWSFESASDKYASLPSRDQAGLRSVQWSVVMRRGADESARFLINSDETRDSVLFLLLVLST